MSAQRPYVISIAGFDPSAGAGVLADVKCFEQHQVYGFGVCSALTVQTDDAFLQNSWLSAEQIIDQLAPLLTRFKIEACKIGLIQSISVLQEVVEFLRSRAAAVKIVTDPVLKASAGYEFHDWQDEILKLAPVLRQIDLITPNYHEMLSLSSNEDVMINARRWAQYCPVLLKGGHNHLSPGTDYLFVQDNIDELKPGTGKIYQKHGSGCVLSAAITANLASDHTLRDACKYAKVYIEKFLNSNTTRLGYHSS